MPSTAAQFRAENTILRSYPILKTPGYQIPDYYDGKPSPAFGAGEYIDLNLDGKIDYTHIERLDIKGESYGLAQFTEPSLKYTLESLRSMSAEGGHGEMLIAQKLTKVPIEDVLHSFEGGWDHIQRENPRSASVLVDELCPLEDNASFALDLLSGEFLIYRPK